VCEFREVIAVALLAEQPKWFRIARSDNSFLVTRVVSTLVALAILAGIASLIKWSFVETLDFAVVYKYRLALLQGLGYTLLITLLSVCLGLFIGTILAICLQLPFAPLRWLISAYVEVLRNTPLVFQLFWVHLVFPYLTGISTTAFQSGCIAMSLQSSAYLADLVRAGIQAVPKGQWDAANALGLPAFSKWAEVILPQAIKIIIPPLANLAIGYFKSSAVLVLLSVGELMTVASRVSTYTFRPIETLTVVGLVYLGLGYLFSTVALRLEQLFKHPET
jgi:polar amino acid transport system permease protein